MHLSQQNFDTKILDFWGCLAFFYPLARRKSVVQRSHNLSQSFITKLWKDFSDSKFVFQGGTPQQAFPPFLPGGGGQCPVYLAGTAKRGNSFN